ncbi:MAG: hypothetical protein FJ150_09445, partial [Euryarchaeota archaeon]|nr:hypothetical protein [Euryarchaeota archaeon]
QTYTISILDTNVAGDVLQNWEINTYIDKTALANEIFEKLKQGSVVLQFGDGTGNKLMIWAGIHGNEEEANVATMRYLEYIKDLNFAGTVYLVPFAIPKDTAINSREINVRPYYYTDWVPYKKVRYRGWYKVSYKVKIGRGKYRRYVWRTKWRRGWLYKWLYTPVTKIGYRGDDPNRIANVAGTPGWNAVEFAHNNGINYILDVHSGGGLTGSTYANGLVYATSSILDRYDGWSCPGEYNWAQYVRSYTGCAVEYGPGTPGMVRIQGHHYGISTITLEVERDHGSTSDYANVELKMIKAACQYFGFPGLT